MAAFRLGDNFGYFAKLCKGIMAVSSRNGKLMKYLGTKILESKIPTLDSTNFGLNT